MNLLVRVATHLKTVMPHTPANGWLGPMNEATLIEVVFLVSGAVRLSDRCIEFFCWSPRWNLIKATKTGLLGMVAACESSHRVDGDVLA